MKILASLLKDKYFLKGRLVYGICQKRIGNATRIYQKFKWSDLTKPGNSRRYFKFLLEIPYYSIPTHTKISIFFFLYDTFNFSLHPNLHGHPCDIILAICPRALGGDLSTADFGGSRHNCLAKGKPKGLLKTWGVIGDLNGSLWIKEDVGVLGDRLETKKVVGYLMGGWQPKGVFYWPTGVWY